LTVQDYKKLLQEADENKLQLTNTDFDTGHDTRAGEYGLTDNTYAHLLDQLAQHNFDQITPDLRDNLLAFYSNPAAPNATKKKMKNWEKTQEELSKLRAIPEPAAPVKTTSEVNSNDEPGLMNQPADAAGQLRLSE
jgi:hypothetical protein